MSTWGATKTSKKLFVEFFKIRGKIVDDSAELLTPRTGSSAVWAIITMRLLDKSLFDTRHNGRIRIELIEVIRKIRELTLDEIGD